MALNASLRKAYRDLLDNKARTFLVIVALVVGVVGVGAVVVAYSILPREMNKNYLGTDPASATLSVDSVDEDLARAVAALPRIAKAEARSEIVGRFQIIPGEWRELWRYVIPDFSKLEVDLFTPEQGAWPPAAGDILLERMAVRVAQAKRGDEVVIKILNRKERKLSFAGTVHAPGLPPAWVENRVSGYITQETLALFGVEQKLDQLKILVAEKQFDKAAIAQTANDLKHWLEAKGRAVVRIDIPAPGKHVHADLMAAFIAMLGAMGLLSLVMSGVLVTNMISALLGRQIRQIGVMKAIGGNAKQISGIYFALVAILGTAALAIGMPISLALGRALANYEAVQMLNFEIFDYRVDLWVYGLVCAVGLIVPLLAAVYPIKKGSRMTVVAALSDHGTGQGNFGLRRLDVALSKVKGGARPLLLSLRNTFRRRGRLVLTLLTLVVAGASFITAMNVRASVNRGVEGKFAATPYDIEIPFSQAYPQEGVERVIGRVEGVERVEAWGGARASIVLPDGMMGGLPLNIIAPLIDTALSPKPPIVQGRWLRPGDTNAIVMSIGLMKKLDIDAALGGEILLDLYGQRMAWRLVGITQEFLSSGAYVPFGYFSRATNHKTSTVVRTTDPSMAEGVSKDLDIMLAAAGFDVYTMWKTADSRKVMTDHMLLVTGTLLVMAALFVIVGGLGLSSTISLNALDRTRELGIMRAIGASPTCVLETVISEGIFIAALSWIFAVLFSIPLTVLMGKVIEIFLESPMDLNTSALGWIIWLLVIIAIGAWHTGCIIFLSPSRALSTSSRSLFSRSDCLFRRRPSLSCLSWPP
jgi:putative ABC transport system permease protein